ncbi:MAG: lipopolysaccharide biosynthesis protein [Deltaproteobacteria bacterium]|nr:MAG: lipopolysaccharide biosynthesis protein [Deltaproteobacteria bacterium]
MSESNAFAKRVALSFVFSGVGNVLGRIGNVVAIFAVLKLLSPEEFGLASLVLAIFVVLQALTELGLGVALVQAREVTRSSLDSLFWLSAALAVGLWGVVAAGAPVMAWFYDEPDLTPLLRVTALGIVLFSLYLIPRNLMVRDLQFGRIAIADNAGLALSAGTMITFAWLGWGPWAIVLGELANRLGQCILCFGFRPFIPRLRFAWDEISAMTRFGLWATGARLVGTLYKNIDFLIVGKAFGPEAVGLYALAYRVVHDPVRTLSNIVSQVAFPAFARLQRERDRLRTYVFAFARISLTLTGTLIIVVALWIDLLLTLISFDHWLDAVPIIHILVLAAVLQAITPILSKLIDAVGQARFNFMHSAGSLVFMTTAFLVGTRFGLEGVAWAWVVAFPFAWATKIVFCAWRTELPPLRFGLLFLGGLPSLVPVLAVGLTLRFGTPDLLENHPLAVTTGGALLTVLTGLGVGALRERPMLRILWQERQEKKRARRGDRPDPGAAPADDP